MVHSYQTLGDFKVYVLFSVTKRKREMKTKEGGKETSCVVESEIQREAHVRDLAGCC